MLKLMIVDDEEIICRSLAELIRQNAPQFDLVGTCLDGVEAYHMILDETPDIVITDIRMPGISGLELIERIHRTSLHTHFMLLSGYGEFEYAKKAMKYGVHHYLLKPCDDKELIDSLLQLEAECLEERRIMESQVHLSQEYHEFQNIMLSNMIQEGILLDEPGSSFFASYSRYADFQETPYQLCRFSGISRIALKQYVGRIDDGFLLTAGRPSCFKLYYADTLVYFFPNYTEDYAGSDRYFRSLSVAGQESPVSYERISYPSLQNLLEELIPLLRNYDQLSFIYEDRIANTYHHHSLNERIKLLVPELLSGDPGKSADSYSEFEQILSSLTERDFLLQLGAQTILYLASQSSTIAMPDVTAFIIGLYSIPDTNVLQKEILSKIKELLAICRAPQKEYSAFIRRTLDYMEEHYADQDLTLKWIAENYLYMNINYVSRCFVRETGNKFSATLIDLRIRHAKEILASSGDKIQNVAELVGCGDNPSYFSWIFKKSTGMTPSAYVRKMAHAGKHQGNLL